MEWPGPEGSLRDIIKRGFSELAREIATLKSVFDTMSERPVKHYELESLKLQVASLAEGLTELEQRIVELERHKGLASLIFRQAITIAIGLLLAYLFVVLK